ncbi:MAG: ATP-binding protein [Pyrobaculum sp.]
MEHVFRELLEEWLSGEKPRVVEREISAVLEPGLAFAVVGPRRAGKTYFLYQLASSRGGFYFNFEDVRLAGLKPRHFSSFLKVLSEYGAGRGALLLLDEVQNIPAWGRWVRSLLDRGFQVALAGSSARLRAGEVSTELRGRYISRLLLPFSFREFLKARGISAAEARHPEARGRLLSTLREYLELGGYPEAVLKPELGPTLLKMYRDTVVYRDVVERHRVRDPRALEVFLHLVESSFARPFSISSAYRAMRGAGFEKSKKTLAAYLHYLEEAYYVVAVPKLGPGKTPLTQPRKIYPIDPGYVKDFSKKMEAAVALELIRREKSPMYYREKREVDFCIPDDRTFIQVTYASAWDEVEKREIEALAEATTKYGGKAQLITWDLEGTLVKGGTAVEAVPLWRWLVEKR